MQRLLEQLRQAHPGRDYFTFNLGSPPSVMRAVFEQTPTTQPEVVVLNHEDHKDHEEPQSPYNGEDNPAGAVRRVLAGDEIVISHAGASQYATPGGGVSACGIAALNCLRIVFGKERDGLRGEALLENIMSREVAEEITLICSQWSSKSHLEVEDIYRVPLFEQSLRRLESRYAESTFKMFREVLSVLESDQASETSSAIVITRPPEIIACLKIVTDSKPVFIIFDSHPRPKHPKGAGFIFNTSREAAATYLHGLLAVDSELLADRDMRWQAQLLGNFSADIFVPQSLAKPPEESQIIVDSSLALLSLKSQLADMRTENSSLSSENRRLQTENSKMKNDLKAAIDSSRKQKQKQKQKQNTKFGWGNTIAGFLPWSDQPHGAGSSSWSSQPVQDNRWGAQQGYNGIPPLQETSSGTGKNRTQGTQHGYDEFPPLPEASSGSGKNRTQRTDDRHTPNPPGPEAAKITPEEEDSNLALIWKLQREFEEEDRRLREERRVLSKFKQAVFLCKICMDDVPHEDIARVEQCRHAFCRDCLRKYILSKVKDHRYPIICPGCTAETKTKKEPGVVSQTTIQTVGIPDEDYIIFEELQLTAFSVFVSCRKCQRTSFVDRTEYQESRIITCPLPDCRYDWCKACQQPIVQGGPEHSCDGTNEFNHLVKKEGWKRCPGCKTPIQKISGCNHMTCTTPGCNMHFCYLCGSQIIQSSLGGDVKEAITAHYAKCVLFETPAGIV